PYYRSLTRGMCVRFAVESAFALPWKLRSVCSGIRGRFAVEYASILGSVQIPRDVIHLSDKLAAEFYATAEESEFCGDQVETYAIPS
ncbi:hypothetical protein QZM52_26120, partial [Burkholderia metallica]|nr:hypothetical protein [Burkholderia metallica]